VIFAAVLLFCQDAPHVDVGSKKFTESVILGEIAAALAREGGAVAEHRRELGGTRILFDALLAGDIDLYPDYTGTIREELLKDAEVGTDAEMRAALSERGIRMSASLGFQNNYVIGVTAPTAERLGLRTISDLKDHPALRFGFSNEFMDRRDGWPGLQARYGLPQRNVRGLDHDLAYRGLVSGGIDATDLYSTDPEIGIHHLALLEDDRRWFPDYTAVLLYRSDLKTRAPEALRSILRMEGRIPREEMVRLNLEVEKHGIPEGRAAGEFLAEEFSLASSYDAPSLWERILARTLEHLRLVGLSLAAAILLAVPLGILAAGHPLLGQFTQGAVGILQTIPTLVLLVAFIPLLGIGALPAMAALFLYSLLPIVVNTHAGLRGIPIELRESARALGLPRMARLRRIELPLAAPSILTGIRTAAVINIGTATLGALIGAGGYGQPILSGIRLADNGLILEGAVPAALLALGAQGLFHWSERWLVPKGLRL